MAGTRKTQDKDVISRLADAGEDALRRLVAVPRRIVGGTMDGVGERLHDVATRLRAIDPLDGRVGAIEKRLDSLEQPKKTTVARRPLRAKPPRASKASTAPHTSRSRPSAILAAPTTLERNTSVTGRSPGRGRGEHTR